MYILTDTCVLDLKAEIAISYSYFQKDDGQRDNFDFFIDHGIGGLRRYPLLQNTDVVIIVSGSECSPCSKLPIYDERHRCFLVQFRL